MELLIRILRAALPAMADGKTKIAQAMFAASLQEDAALEEAEEDEEDIPDEKEVPACLQEILDREAGREKTTEDSESAPPVVRPSPNGRNGRRRRTAVGANRNGDFDPEHNGKHS